ncbi:hypothetical protein BH11PSE6_BH11PSE6_12260 [soil metagenome]
MRIDHAKSMAKRLQRALDAVNIRLVLGWCQQGVAAGLGSKTFAALQVACESDPLLPWDSSAAADRLIALDRAIDGEAFQPLDRAALIAALDLVAPSPTRSEGALS